jgi:hypothetical protein
VVVEISLLNAIQPADDGRFYFGIAQSVLPLREYSVPVAVM